MKNTRKVVWKWFKRIVLFYFAISIVSVIIFRWVPFYVTPMVIIRYVKEKFDKHPVPIQKTWVSIDEISPNLQLAVFCSEDQDFFHHHGFNFQAIQAAWKHDEHSKKIRGASTISQQAARCAFLTTNRSWIRKGFEVYFTGLTELFWSKKRIMEVYLNVIEFGKGIFGAEAAAEYYYHKHAKDLTRQEAAALASILPDPLKWSPVNPGPYVAERQQWIVGQMNNYGTLNINNPPK
jgi:monofunctional biosynthetic peptidoglycan transglycosylase